MCSGRPWSETCGERGCRCVGRRRLHFATAMAMQGSCALQAPRPQQTEGRWFAWPCPLPPGLDQQRHAAQGKPGTAHANAKRLHAAAHELGRQAAVSLEAWLTPAAVASVCAFGSALAGSRRTLCPNRTCDSIREHSQCGSLHDDIIELGRRPKARAFVGSVALKLRHSSVALARSRSISSRSSHSARHCTFRRLRTEPPQAGRQVSPSGSR